MIPERLRRHPHRAGQWSGKATWLPTTDCRYSLMYGIETVLKLSIGLNDDRSEPSTRVARTNGTLLIVLIIVR